MQLHTIEQELKENGKLLRTTVGNSMEPMLRNRQNVVVIETVEGDLKKYDLPLYKRPTGQFVMHRILKVRNEDYIICGDNRYHREIVPKEWILGVVTGYYKKGKYIPVTDQRYQRYVHIWCDCFYLRAGILWLRTLPKRIKRKIIQK